MERGQVLRVTTALEVTFPSGSPTSNAFYAARSTIGLVWLPSGTTGLALGAQVATAGGSFANLVDRSNAYGTDVSCILPTAQLAALHACPMPGYWFGGYQMKLFTHNLSGSGIPQTSARVCTITLKT